MEKSRDSWSERVKGWVFLGGFLYAIFFVQGLPLWNEDYSGVLRNIASSTHPYTIWHSLGELISPVSRHAQEWGFTEKPLQVLFYQLCHAISGFESWSYFLFKSVAYGGMALLIYLWGLRLAPRAPMGALAAAIFFVLAPGSIAAEMLQSDFAPFAELILLGLTYFLWREVERTPVEWTGFPSSESRGQRHWLIRWSILCALAYLGFKAKTEVRLLPLLFALYILATRRPQWRLFLVPGVFLTLLAVPWGHPVFHGARYYAPSLERLRDFLWSAGSSSLYSTLSEPTLSLSAVLGPFLLLMAVGVAAFKFKSGERPKAGCTIRHARTFAAIWFLVSLVWASTLPPVNFFFGIRYGIITLVPASLLLAWVMGEFILASAHYSRWVFLAGMLALFLQGGVNLGRSIHFRRDMGQVMVAVDQAYDTFNRNFSSYELALLPDFFPYPARPNAARSLASPRKLARIEELKGKHEAFRTYVLSWKPSAWPEVEVVGQVSGCHEASLFDRIFPCVPGSGAVLMRHIGADPLFTAGVEKRERGDWAEARKLHEQFVARYPFSLAGLFVLGGEAAMLQDWNAAHEAYSRAERLLPDDPSILLSHARVLAQLKFYDQAIERARTVVRLDPENTEALKAIRLWTEEAKG